VNVGVYHPDKPYASVGGDNEAAAYRACRYLIELGHARIGMVAAVSRHNDCATARVSGVRRALAENALSLRPEWYVEVPYHLDDARQGARFLLSAPEDQWPTAVVCGNDVIAYGVLLEAERCGLKVPEDLSVIGFDDLEWSRHLRPSRTTMHVPTDEVWTRAGEFLVHSLPGRTAALHHEVDVSLVVRRVERASAAALSLNAPVRGREATLRAGQGLQAAGEARPPVFEPLRSRQQHGSPRSALASVTTAIVPRSPRVSPEDDHNDLLCHRRQQADVYCCFRPERHS